MVSAVVLAATAVVAYWLLSTISSLRANLAKARKTGLPYIVVPCSPYGLAWKTAARPLLFLVKLLPKRLWQDWIFIMYPDWGYKFGQAPFERLGSDSFLVVGPGCIHFNTQSPAAIHQVTSRREHFPKATVYYSLLELYGRNILTTEGATWRFHRKVTSASFNEKNAAHTFAEAIHQTQGLVRKWSATAAAAAGGKRATIMTIEQDTMTLALNIIGYVGFGIRFAWPGEPVPADTDSRMRKYGSAEPAPGHTMSFAASVERVLHRILLILVLPPWLLRVLGLVLAAPREAYEANANYARYMHEFLADKVAAAQEAEDGGRSGGGGGGDGGMDLMGHLVRGRYEEEKKKKKRAEPKTASSPSSLPSSSLPSSSSTLTDDEIVGNAFVMLVAGHETTANSLHFGLLLLASHPASQRALQADVDRLLGRDTDPATWNYEASINGMLASMLGATMNETLRLIPPVVIVPKWVSPHADQPLTLPETGQTHVLPAGIDVSLSAVTAHRNPKYWPAAGGGSDLDAFRPERWFETGGEDGSSGNADETVDGADTDDYGGFKGPDTSAQLFRPVRGSFVPFSDGPRSCLGRRIAQVEMLAALAVLFQRHSIELAVDDWADDAAVAAMDASARAALYRRAQDRTLATLRTASTLVTLKLHGSAAVPVRLVPRGEERFVHML